MERNNLIAHLRGLEPHLRARIVEQDHVLPRIAGLFARGELGLSDPVRPRGSLLLVGPTGTGKSETLACATDYVFGAGHLVTFDMSEYQDDSSVAKFLGADRDDPGLLGRALLRHSRGCLFFDEMEKACPRLLDVFLQILWDGRVTVATGQTFSFAPYYVAFASNLGGAEATRMERSTPAGIEHAILRRVRQTLRAEFVARIDEVLVFGKLSREAQRSICALVVKQETDRLRSLGFDLEVSKEAMEYFFREGFHPHWGARCLKKVVERKLQGAVIDALFASGCGWGRVMRDESRLVLKQ